MGIRSTPPFTLTFLRFAVATACMALIALAVRARWPSSRRELGHLAVAGTLVQGVQFLGVYAGIELGVPAAISSLVIGISPVLTALLARPVLGERVSRRRRWGFVLGVAGVVLAVSRGLHPTSHAFAGIGLTPLSLLALSGGTVYQKRFCPDMELRTGQTMRLLASTVLAGACSLASGTLYPILGRLTDRGMLETCWEDDPRRGARAGTCTGSPPRVPSVPPHCATNRPPPP